MKKILLLSLMVLLLGCTSNNQVDTVKIGAIIGLTGNDGFVGVWTQQGLELAKDEINNAGGINGKPIEIIYEDTQYSTQKATTSAFKLINQDKAHALITMSGASVALSVLPIANQSKTVQMELICIIPACETKNDYLFRASGPPQEQAKMAATYSFDTLKKRSTAILYVNNDYGLNQRNVFKEHFTGTITGEENYELGENEFRTSLVKLSETSPEMLFIAGHPADMGFILEQLGELNINTPTMGTFTSKNKQTLDIAKKHAQNHYFPYFKNNIQENTIGKRFAKNYQEKYGENPEVFATKGYDGLYLLATAMKNCPEPLESTCIKKELEKIKNFEAASGLLSINQFGDLTTEDFSIYQIKNGEFTQVS